MIRPAEMEAPEAVAAAPGAEDQVNQCAAIVGHADEQRKRTATLQAQAALHGIALRRLDDGRWLASRWNLSRELADAEVEGWLAAVTGARS